MHNDYGQTMIEQRVMALLWWEPHHSLHFVEITDGVNDVSFSGGQAWDVGISRCFFQHGHCQLAQLQPTI